MLKKSSLAFFSQTASLTNLNDENMSRKLLKSALVTGSMTLLSRVTGLLRDMIFARMIGAGIGVAADAFYVAFRIPNFLRRIFGEGAFSQAFVPVFSQYKTRGDPELIQEFLDYVAGILTLVLILVTLVVTLIAPLVVVILAPGFLADPAKYDLTVQMLRIMFPYLLFISLVSMAGGILNTYGRFGVPAFTPVLLNLSLIGAALWLAPRMAQPVIGLAWGVFIAGVAQLLFQLPSLHRLRLLPRPRINFKHEGVRRMFGLMLPAVFSVSVAQINLLVNMILASYLVTGSVSWLYYSDRLMEFPLGVFGVALATVILPSLSQKHAQASREEFSHTLDWALRVTFIIAVPATVGLLVMSAPLLISLFQYGAFSAHDVAMTRYSLIAFVVGLPAFVLIKILAPGFYARQDMKTPVRIGVIAVAVNIVTSFLLVFPLAHGGLALATSLAAMVNAGLLFQGLRTQNVYIPLPGWSGFLSKIVLASVLMGIVLWWEGADTAAWLNASAGERVTRLAFWIIIGMLIYTTAMIILGVKLQELLKPTGFKEDV
jgi:putative peptidoglycan lipid II flippase